ncbi:MAG: alpha-N-arabinofuranosidase, partial [Mangrovibacterium sp.]
ILCVVNRHKDQAVTTDLIAQEGVFDGDFEVYEVNGPDIKSVNNFGKTTVQTQQKSPIKVKNTDKITYSFAPHSFTMIKGKIRK